MAKANRFKGSKFVDFLIEEGIKDDVDLLTLKKVLADEIEMRMKKKHINHSELAKRMSTSRNQVYRLLDESDTGITLGTLSKAAQALDWSIIDLIAAAELKAKRERTR
jgi:antitoxin HicB